MSAPAYPLPHHPFTTPHRRQATLLVLFALLLTRSVPIMHTKALADLIPIKKWREERRSRKEERQRRESETPLSVSASV